MSSTQPISDTQLSAEAADWLVRLTDTGPTQDEPDADPAAPRAEFYAWLTQSRRHLETFLETAATFEKLGSIDSSKKIDVRSLLDNPAANVVPLFDARASEPDAASMAPMSERRPKWRGRLIAGAALAATMVAIALILGWPLYSKPHYVTSVGEQRSWRLDDGSVVYLNTHSRLDVEFSKTVRQVRLLEGQALFVVEHDTARPFIVDTGTASIRAIGTQFDVYRRSTGTEVAVVEGVVQVAASNTAPAEAGSASPSLGPINDRRPSRPKGAAAVPSSPTNTGAPAQTLAAGEEASITNGQVIKHLADDVNNAVAWRQRQLVFRRATLAEVADEFNRYNQTQIHIEGDALRGKRLSGTFSADHPQALIMYLSKDPSLSVQSNGDLWIVQPR